MSTATTIRAIIDEHSCADTRCFCYPDDAVAPLAELVEQARRDERERIARYLDRAAGRKRHNTETWFSSEAICANTLTEAAQWCRDETIWNEEGM